MRYVALLRGINVGGTKKVEMFRLKEMMELLGFTDVKTLLNSGNVAFDTDLDDVNDIKNMIEEKIQETFGFSVPIVLRTLDQIQKYIVKDPFQGIIVTSQMRLYVTFLSSPSKSMLHTPYVSPKKDFTILSVSETEIASVLVLTSNRGTTDVMKVLEKEFGKEITTRNWNTVQKIAAL